MLFPLPLAAFEEYMLVDGSPAYPMDGFLRVRFSGRFDRSALARAQEEAFARHPLLLARVAPGPRGRPQWIAPVDGPPPVSWLPRPADGGFPAISHRLDLSREGGVRVLVAEDDSRSDLIMHLHHSTCDGLGGYQFLHDLMVCYARATGASRPGPLSPPVNPENLKLRGRFGLSAWKLLRILPKQMVGLLGVRQFLQRVAQPLTPVEPRRPDDPLPACYPSGVVRVLDEGHWAGLRAAATRLGTTTNDLLARELFLALDEWRQRHFPQHDPDWTRLSVPMNLRGLGGIDYPAANVVSMVFLDRRRSDLATPDRLLRGINEEMSLIKRLNLGLTFIFSLQAARFMPGGMARAVKSNCCSATCVFSNFGAPWAKADFPVCDGRTMVGNLVLESADALPPLRPYTNVTMVALGCAGRLSLALHYDPAALTRPQADDLADRFAARVRNVAET